jgi:2'-5' RNA ligase
LRAARLLLAVLDVRISAAQNAPVPRLFVALELPDDVQAALAGLCHGLPSARWVEEGGFHLTLAFLGDVEGPRFAAVRDGLHSVRCDPFELQLRGIGHFPPRGTPQVVWVGVEDDAAVTTLAERVGRCLRRLGVRSEERRFHAHVTLARLRDTPLPDLLHFIEQRALWRAPTCAVTDFQLYSSVLGREGARHAVESSYPLLPGRTPS